MAMDFNTLTETLSLTGPERLNALADWCRQTISSDCQYGGSTAEQYEAYRDLAEDYLDNFLLRLPANPMQSVPEFDELNAIQYAALHGYDRWLMAQPSLNTDALNMGNEAGMTPLHLAALGGHINTLKVLLDSGASPNQANQLNQYPIYSSLVLPILAESELKARKMTIFQILNTAAPDTAPAIDANGNNLAHMMAINGYAALNKELLAAHRELYFQANNHSQYPIHSAILNTRLAIVKELLSVDGMAILQDAQQQTPLHYAARYGSADIMSACCAHHPDLNVRDASGKTALILAAESNNFPAAKILINQKADPELTDYTGENVLHYAERVHNPKMVEWILDNTNLHNNTHSP